MECAVEAKGGQDILRLQGRKFWSDNLIAKKDIIGFRRGSSILLLLDFGGFCGGKFCSKHRLLESHACPNLEDCKKESHAQNASKLISERTVAIRGV